MVVAQAAIKAIKVGFHEIQFRRVETHSNEAGDGAELFVDDLECFGDGVGVTDVALVSLETEKVPICVNESITGRDRLRSSTRFEKADHEL